MTIKVSHWVKITPASIIVDGTEMRYDCNGMDMLVAAYRKHVGDYPKFFKMDSLSRLGFLASELLTRSEEPRFVACEDRAIILFNRGGSVCCDKHYQETIKEGNFFPSPSVFVYTLPNIVTGEIAIRNKYYGESSFYVLDSWSPREIIDITMQSFADLSTTSAVTGWVDAIDDNDFEALMFLVSSSGDETEMSFNEENLSYLKTL